MFREDAKRLYRELGNKTIKIQKPPDIREVKKLWQNILEQETSHHEDAQWIKDQQEELKDINQMEWKDFTVGRTQGQHNQSSQLEVTSTRQTPQLLDQAVH